MSVSILSDSQSRPSWSISILIVVVSTFIFFHAMSFLRSKTWRPQGKHVLITGGSQGLGLAVAKLVASRGADVTLCARSKDKLEKAVEEVRQCTSTPSQRIAYISADISNFAEAQRVLAEASSLGAEQIGRSPDIVFCCAGGAKPGFFLQTPQADFEAGFRTDYMTALATSHAAASHFVQAGKRDAKIVLVGSTLSLMGLVGYSQYSPMKFAIRGLAECLRSEFQLYSIDIHTYFPGTILSPGYEQENRTKPQITKDLEGDDSEGLSPEECAKALIKGIERNHFFITSDLQTNLFRAATATGGSVPGNNWVMDTVLSWIALIGLPVWRIFVADHGIRKHREEHLRQLANGKPV